MPWIAQASTVLQTWFGGNETGHAIADILFGKANPSGKLAQSFPVKLQDSPGFLGFRTSLRPSSLVVPLTVSS
jgi:beta-glucosidase